MISFTTGGSTQGTEAFLAAMAKGAYLSGLDSICQQGVEELRAATPIESGITSESWDYEIEETNWSLTIWFFNKNVVEGFNVAVGLQYGHATGTAGWVQGYDYINPALQPIFDQIADKVWKEVQNA